MSPATEDATRATVAVLAILEEAGLLPEEMSPFERNLLAKRIANAVLVDTGKTCSFCEGD